jgi:excisionase family DNA binding protein
MNSPFLTTSEAGSYLNISPRTLEKYRSQGGGPPYRRFGRSIRYHEDELESWAEEQRRSSTSDSGLSRPSRSTPPPID